jgi:hypothetical protein
MFIMRLFKTVAPCLSAIGIKRNDVAVYYSIVHARETKTGHRFTAQLHRLCRGSFW